MAMLINMSRNGITKSVPVGFSWTTLFFGFFVPLFRGDWLWFLIMVILGLLSFGGINIIFSFLYNRIFVSGLINKGWTPADQYSYEILRSKGIVH